MSVRVSRARFNFATQCETRETPAERAKEVASSSHPPRPTEPQAGEPATKVRKLAEVVKPVSIATPLRNTILPDGADWSGVTVVFASDTSSVAQAAVEKQILEAGGKVGAAISQRTSLVVLGGNLPDGRPPMESAKYQRFLDLQSKGKVQAKVLSEAAFLSLLPTQPPPAPATTPAIPQSSMPAQKPKLPQSTKKLETSKSSPLRNWVDIFSPKQLEDLLGNQAPIRKLADWLQDWEDVVLRGKSKKPAFRHGSVPDNLNVLVSGPPGIGKTTTCRLVAQLQGRYVLEFNASDSRGQKVIQEMAAGIAENTTISFAGGRQGQRKVVIIMDEVDGMGGGDKGGIAALIKMIKRTRNPIICICNDQHTQQVRSLASSCYDLKFTRPPKNAIAQRCAQIARQQGLQVDVAAVEAIVESSGNDVRVVLNHLQMMKAARAAAPSCSILTESPGRLGKDQEVMLSPFDVCRKLLTSSEANSLAFQARFEMFFVDHSLVSMLVHENYLRSIERQPVSSEVLNRCAYSADLMTIGDVMSQRMVVEQEWSFLPHCAAVGCAYPTFVTRGLSQLPFHHGQDVFTIQVQAFAPDDLYLAACGNGFIHVYNTSTSQLAFKLLGGRSEDAGLPVTQVRWRPECFGSTKSILVSVGADGKITHWHAFSGRQMHEIVEPENQLFCLDFLYDGTQFATAGKQRHIRIYDESTKKLVQLMRGGNDSETAGPSNRVFSLKYHPLTRHEIVSGGWDSSVQIWDVRQGRAVRVIAGPHICGEALDISQDGRTMLTGSWRIHDQLQLWDLRMERLLATWPPSKSTPCMIYAAQFSKDESSSMVAAGGSGDHEVKVFQRMGSEAASAEAEPFGKISSFTQACYSVDFANAGDMLAAAGGDGVIQVINIHTQSSHALP
ncbi:Gnf1 [Symbiodinium sp. CCMP2456]|nr:Gnf1 [Symbiodinium sp. CCMP2456]